MKSSLSSQFAEVLFAGYPEWRGYIAPNQADEIGLLVKVPSPNPKLSSGLYIEVDSEITVGTDWYHSHFWGDAGEAIERAMAFIDGFLTEKVVVLAFFNRDKWTGSWCVSLEDSWPVPKLGERRQILSWTGSLDAEMAG